MPTHACNLLSEGKGTVTFDVVSLMPPTFRNHANGLRPDLAGMLYDLHPKFLRFLVVASWKVRSRLRTHSAGSAPSVPSRHVRVTTT